MCQPNCTCGLNKLLPSEAIHQRVLYCEISDITNHRTDK